MQYLKPLLVIVAFLLICAVIVIGLAFSELYSSIKPEKFVSNVTPSDYDLKYENVTLRTEDNVSLDSWFIPSASETNRTIIVLHGYPYDKGTAFPTAMFLAKESNLFFFDFRYLGRSEGTHTSFGFHERKDVAAAMRYLREKNQTRIGLFGFSFGGAIALMEAEASEVDAVVSDSSFASLDSIISQTYSHFLIFRPLFEALTKIMAKTVLGIDTASISPENAVRSLNIPLMVIHSSEDSEIGVEHAYRLKNANPEIELWIIDQERHVFVTSDREDEYRQRVTSFFLESLD